MSRHDSLVCVRQMLDHAREATAMVRGRTRADLDSDRMLNLSVMRLLEVMGEAATRIPDDYRLKYAQVPWREAIGLRNRLIHGYDVINLDMVWAVLQEDLPRLIAALEEIVDEQS